MLTYEKPSETGRIIQGATVDTFPASETMSEWCSIVEYSRKVTGKPAEC